MFICSVANAALFGYVKLLDNCNAYSTYLAHFSRVFQVNSMTIKKKHAFKISLKGCNVYKSGSVEGVSIEILARDGNC
jgi:hypothetical protein